MKIIMHGCGITETQTDNGHATSFALPPLMVKALLEMRNKNDPDLDGALKAHLKDRKWLDEQEAQL